MAASRGNTVQPHPRATRGELAVVLGLGSLILAAYGNCFDGGFVLDSAPLITQAQRVHAASAENLRLIFTTDYWWPYWVSGAYRPLTTLSFLVEYAVFGYADQPAGYHWTNVLVHWLNTILVYRLARRVISHQAPAFFAAALFAAHPIATDVVTNLAGRADLLASAAVLGTLLLYARSQHAARRRRWLWLGAAGAVMTAGVFSKETALVGLPLVMLWDLTRQGRRPQDRIPAWTRTAAVWAALAAPIGLFFTVRQFVYEAVSPFPVWFTDNNLIATEFWRARLTACKIIWKYLALLIWPQHLSWDYSVNQIKLFDWTLQGSEDWQAIAALLSVIAIALSAIAARRRSPALLFYVGFFLVALVPTSNLLILIPAVMAERFLYLPSIGFAGAVAVSVCAVARRLRGARGDWASTAAYAALATVTLLYAVGTYQRNFDWRDDLTVCGRAVETSPDSFRVHKCLARALYTADAARNIDRAIAEAETAQAILEQSAPAGTQVPGFVLEDLGVYYGTKADLIAERDAGSDSDQWRRKAVDVLNRAVAWQQQANEDHRQYELRRGKTPAEIRDFANVQVYQNLASIYLQLGSASDAVVVLERARKLAPTMAETYVNLGAAKAALGRTEEAIVTLLQALLIDRNRPDVWPQLFPLYQRLDPGNCAFTVRGSDYSFNEACPLARRHICQAYDRLIAGLVDAGSLSEAHAARDEASRTYACELREL